MKRPLWCLALLALECSRFASEKRIELRYTPKENVTANTPGGEGLSALRAIEVPPLTDARALPDKNVVGENREHSTPVPIRATSPVEGFATAVLKQCLSEWGVRLGAGELQLRGEITNLMVTEDQTYSTAVSMRFRLEDRAGKALWDGVVMGDAHQWGSSFKEENYVEEISDALKKTFANLVSDPGFRAALSGRALFSITTTEMKAKILELMKENVADDVIASFVRGQKLASPLTADEILDWKRTGISETVIKAALP